MLEPDELKKVIGLACVLSEMLAIPHDRQIRAVFYVKEKGRITNKEYQEICDTSERTASRDLANLVDMDIFTQIGTTGKGTGYALKGKDAKDATKAP